MPCSRLIKRLSEDELMELRKQLIDPLDRGWIQSSTAGHAAAVVFARKPDGSCQICYRGLNSITRPAVEPLQHIDTLLDSTRGSRCFTTVDLASAYHQLLIREADRWKTSFRIEISIATRAVLVERRPLLFTGGLIAVDASHEHSSH